MRFNTDEIKPFYEVRQNLSKAIDEVERGGSEIVIAKHGKPVAALLSAAGLYRYREMQRVVLRVRELLQTQSDAGLLCLDGECADLARQLLVLSGSRPGAPAAQGSDSGMRTIRERER